MVVLWCFYPIAILVLVELFLGGGFDDDNDDQDGGMLIPAYSNSKNWVTKSSNIKFFITSKVVNINIISLVLLAFSICLSLSWLLIKTLNEGREALKEIRRNNN